jgi:hypothetical protein
MAQRIIIVDDITGEDADRTITFALNGQAYSIDLTESNAKTLEEFLAPYIEAGRKETGLRRPVEPERPPVVSSGYPKGWTLEIKEWLRTQGKDYPTYTGRIRDEDMELWELAFPEKAARLRQRRR